MSAAHDYRLVDPRLPEPEPLDCPVDCLGPCGRCPLLAEPAEPDPDATYEGADVDLAELEAVFGEARTEADDARSCLTFEELDRVAELAAKAPCWPPRIEVVGPLPSLLREQLLAWQCVELEPAHDLDDPEDAQPTLH